MASLHSSSHCHWKLLQQDLRVPQPPQFPIRRSMASSYAALLWFLVISATPWKCLMPSWYDRNRSQLLLILELRFCMASAYHFSSQQPLKPKIFPLSPVRQSQQLSSVASHYSSIEPGPLVNAGVPNSHLFLGSDDAHISWHCQNRYRNLVKGSALRWQPPPWSSRAERVREPPNPQPPPSGSRHPENFR